MAYSMTRRTFLAATAGTMAVLAAGCSDQDAESGSTAIIEDSDDLVRTWWGVNTIGVLSELTLNDDATWEWNYSIDDDGTEGKLAGEWQFDESEKTVALVLADESETITFEATVLGGVRMLKCSDADNMASSLIATSTFYDDEDARDEAAEEVEESIDDDTETESE